jgi:hypothetical protein
MAIEISACPRLPEVLARLTTCDDAGWWRDVAARYDFRFDGEVILGAVGSGVTYDVGRFRPLHRAAAMEELVAAGLLPEQWLDDALAPRWWCERSLILITRGLSLYFAHNKFLISSLKRSTFSSSTQIREGVFDDEQ